MRLAVSLFFPERSTKMRAALTTKDFSVGGNFLLYSVGWNEKEDDGLPEKENGDWVWPTTVTE
jgi:hypothetical protein